MSDGEMKKVSNCFIYPRDSNITTGKGFINIDNGQMGGTHCTWFSLKKYTIILLW